MTSASLNQLLDELSRGDSGEALNTIGRLQNQGDPRSAVIGRLILAIRAHDPRQVEAIAASPDAALLREDPNLHSMLARALYWTAGLQPAAAELETVCASDRLGGDNPSRREACALAALARLTDGLQLRRIEGAREASVGLLAGQALPIFLASINALQPEYFILDTGAPTSLLSRSYCDRAGIPYISGHAKTALDGGGNQITLFPALVDRLEFGGLAVRNWTANVTLLSPKLRVAGIISPLDTFRELAAELDLRTRRLRVYADLPVDEWIDAACEPIESAALLWEDGNVFVRATVNESATGWFLFDTGSPADFIVSDLLKSLGEVRARESEIESATAGGTTRVWPGFEGTLAVGDSAPVRTKFMIKDRTLDRDAIAPLAVSGYVGLPWMAGRRLLFAPDGHRVLFTAPASS